jgi:cellulose synthase/poly-beta-1,6-N-acetylglucosamine synthase-like glycosyltransferase
MDWQAGDAGTPLVSIVIPAYNEEDNVRRVFEAIQSALGGRETIEVIFVDDGSTDGTAERIRDLRAQHSSVRLIRFGRNFGQQPALVAGIEAARGPWLLPSTAICNIRPNCFRACWRLGAAGVYAAPGVVGNNDEV